MPTTPVLGISYPAAIDPPDGPGGFYALANSLETGALEQHTWAPALIGTGTVLGTGGGTDGYVTRLGRHIEFNGRIAFGTGASFGSGAPAVGNVNAFGNMSVDWTDGDGWFDFGPNGASFVNQRVPMKYTPLNGSQFYIHVANLSPLGPPTSLGTPPQSSVLHINIRGVLA